MVRSFEYKDTMIVVDFEFHPAWPGSYLEPPEHEYVEVEKVLSASGDDITGLFADNPVWRELEDKVLEEFKKNG